MKKYLRVAFCLFFCLAFACIKGPDPASGTAQFRTSQGAFNWEACKGQSLFISLNKHPYTEALIHEIPEFERLTGIKVDYNILAEEEYFEKLVIGLSTRSRNLDVFMTGPQLNWGYIDSGWVEPLDAFLGDKDYVPEDYGIDDFYPSLLAANRWNKIPGKRQPGKGQPLGDSDPGRNLHHGLQKGLGPKKRTSVPAKLPRIFIAFARELSRAGETRTAS